MSEFIKLRTETEEINSRLNKFIQRQTKTEYVAVNAEERSKVIELHFKGYDFIDYRYIGLGGLADIEIGIGDKNKRYVNIKCINGAERISGGKKNKFSIKIDCKEGGVYGMLILSAPDLKIFKE